MKRAYIGKGGCFERGKEKYYIHNEEYESDGIHLSWDKFLYLHKDGTWHTSCGEENFFDTKLKAEKFLSDLGGKKATYFILD